jgi:hypothetical protein
VSDPTRECPDVDVPDDVPGDDPRPDDVEDKDHPAAADREIK